MKKFLRDGLIIFLITFAIAEIGARVATKTADNGMPVFLRFELLPYRQDKQVVLDWEKKVANAQYMIADDELGWTIAKGGTGPNCSANEEGVRGDRPYGAGAAPGKVRIVTFGDSFTHGDGVKNDETWQHYLESEKKNLDVLNLGVPGYGTDQALLRYKRNGTSFGAHIAILGIWPENMCRNLNMVRFYLVPTGAYSSKPRYLQKGEGIEVLNSPVVKGEALAGILDSPENAPLLANEFWYSPEETAEKFSHNSRLFRVFDSLLNLRRRKAVRADLYSGSDPRGIEITTAIAEEFAREAKRQEQIPVILLIPMANLLMTDHAQENGFPLVKALRAKGLDVIDMGPPLAKAAQAHGLNMIYMPDGHLSPAGNKTMAQELGVLLEPFISKVKTSSAS